VADGVAQSQQPAPAVPEEEQRLPGGSRADELDERIDVVDQVREALDVRARPLRPAVAALVERMDGVAGARECFGEVGVAASVVADAVEDDHGAAWRCLR